NLHERLECGVGERQADRFNGDTAASIECSVGERQADGFIGDTAASCGEGGGQAEGLDSDTAASAECGVGELWPRGPRGGERRVQHWRAPSWPAEWRRELASSASCKLSGRTATCTSDPKAASASSGLPAAAVAWTRGGERRV